MRESGGASPQQGFHYQNVAAAYFLLTTEPDLPEQRPNYIRLEQEDSDFYFEIQHDMHTDYHYFESKWKESGEIKYGSEFKNTTFPEFYRIYNLEDTGEDERVFFHLVTNGAAAKKINKLAEKSERIRKTSYTKKMLEEEIERKYGGLLSELENNNRLEREGIEQPESIADLYPPIWGFVLHTPTEREMVTEIQNHLQKIRSTGFRKLSHEIIEYIADNVPGLVQRSDIEDEFGISLQHRSGVTTAKENRSGDKIRGRIESVEDNLSPKTREDQILRDQEAAREYGNLLGRIEQTDDNLINTMQDDIDEEFEELRQIEKERSNTEHQLSQKIRMLKEQDPNFNDD